MPPATTSTHLSPAELAYLHASLSSHPPIRPDARLSTDFRPLNAETNVLPNTMGSAHVGLADGREAVVGVRAEVEKTTRRYPTETERHEFKEDVEMQGSEEQNPLRKGRPEWVTLSLTLPGLRDDDKDLVFLEETLREVLIIPSPSHPLFTSNEKGSVSLQDALVINRRWHWHLYIDVLLISPPESSSLSSGSGSGSASTTPLPLLSMAIYFALRDTRIPRLKSEGDEDPVADDDWDASIQLYSQYHPSKAQSQTQPLSIIRPGLTPPVTLLVASVAENVLFDPSPTELAVADGVWAISIGRYTDKTSSPTATQTAIKILGIRTLETAARDTMKGVPRDADPSDPNNTTAQTTGHRLGSGTDQVIPGVWKPKVGGVKRNVLTQVLKAVVGKGSQGVGTEILNSLDGFLVGQK